MNDRFRATVVDALTRDDYHVPSITPGGAARHALDLAMLLDLSVWLKPDLPRGTSTRTAFRAVLKKPDDTPAGWLRVDPSGSCEARGALVLVDWEERDRVGAPRLTVHR